MTTTQLPTEVRELVALGSRVLAHQGQSDLIWGHVSGRDPGGRGVWMKRAGIGFDEVTAEDVQLVSWTGDLLEGRGERHVEWPIHARIMVARPHVHGVAHTHTRSAVALVSTGAELRPISHEGCLFVPPAIPVFTRTGDLVVTEELGDDLARTLGDRPGALMANHGMVTVGRDVGAAVATAVLLDRACEVNLRTLAAGGVQSWSDDAEALAKRASCWPDRNIKGAWDYLVRQLERASS